MRLTDPRNSLLKMVKQLCDNGVNFIKEDEILGSPLFCTLKVSLREGIFSISNPLITSEAIILL